MSTHKDEGKFTKKQQRIVLSIIVLIVACIIGTAATLTMKGDKIAKEEIAEYLSEISFQTSYKVNQRMDTNLTTLLRLQEELSAVSQDDKDVLIDCTLSLSAYEEIGFVDAAGVFHTSKGNSISIAQTNILTDLKTRKNSISDTLVENTDGEKGVVYAVSIAAEDSIALAGWIPTDTMELLLNTDTFKGIGFSHIVSVNGDYILSSKNENAVLNQGDNFFDMLEKLGNVEDTSLIQIMKKNMQNKEAGSINYSVAGSNQRSLTYVPLPNSNWYLLSIVPSDAYVQDIHTFTNQAILAVALISVILFTVVSVAIFAISLKKNKVISDIAYVDPVTAGNTKTRFEQEWKDKTEQFSPYSYVIIDIRKFKLINDKKGSHGGDDVLRHVYRCIQKHLHKGEFTARLQADMFEVVFDSVSKEEVAQRLVDIAEEINAFNKERNTPYYLPIDCGIYLVESKDEDLVIIRDRANSARKNNKENNQAHLCSCTYYNDLERIQMVQEKEIDNAMEKALENGEFIVYLQPKVNIHTNKVAGAEALIRWDSPTMGFMSPDKFIPYFEKNGFIVKLDQYVFEKVCKQLREWIDQGIEPVPISVNLSRRDLYDHKYLERYKEIQEHYQVPSKLLEIEFTETLFFEDLELLKQSIQEVHEAGYLCSIDDFGSGYSSLALLKEIPVDILKLDKTFFDNITDARGNTVIEHVIALAKDLDMTTIAEGIENVIQVDRLRSIHCDLIQGYVYYKPMTIENFNQIVQHDYEIIEI